MKTIVTLFLALTIVSATAQRSTGISGPVLPSSGPADMDASAVIHFGPMDPENVDAIREDLQIMARVLEKKLDSVLESGAPPYRMGIPLLLRHTNKRVQGMYLEGFGALLEFSVSFPLVAGPAEEEVEVEQASPPSDWEAAKRELSGRARPSMPPGFASNSERPKPYDSAKVETLKRQLLESLKEATNIRNLKSDEYIAVIVTGPQGANTRGSGRSGFTGAAGYGAAGMAGAYGGFGTAGLGANPPADGPSPPLPPPAGGGGMAGGGGGIGMGTSDPGTTFRMYYGSIRGAARMESGSLLTLRVTKEDVDKFASGDLSFEAFSSRASIHGDVAPGWDRGADPYGSPVLFR